MVGSGIIFRWPTHRSDSGACGTRTRSPAFASSRCAVCSVIRRRASLRSPGAQKNGLRVRAGGIIGWYDLADAQVRDLPCGDSACGSSGVELRRVDAGSCGRVKRERLDLLADESRVHARFRPLYVGPALSQRDGQGGGRRAVARLGYGQEMEKHYMHAQLARAGSRGPRRSASTRSRFGRVMLSYRRERSDPPGRRWFGGGDRSDGEPGAVL